MRYCISWWLVQKRCPGLLRFVASGNLLENRAWILMPAFCSAHSTKHKVLTTAVVGETIHFENLKSAPWNLLYFVDRESCYKFLLMTNLTHFFMYLFILYIYMFRASQLSSPEDQIVLIHHQVWLVCVSDCLVCRFLGLAYLAVTQTNHTRWCINTIWSSERWDARNK